jgi:hypothetical protein
MDNKLSKYIFTYKIIIYIYIYCEIVVYNINTNTNDNKNLIKGLYSTYLVVWVDMVYVEVFLAE